MGWGPNNCHHNQVVALMVLLEAKGGPLPAGVLESESEGVGRSGWYALRKLNRVGLVAKPFHGHWMLTERGRLACALLMATKPRLMRAYLVE